MGRLMPFGRLAAPLRMLDGCRLLRSGFQDTRRPIAVKHRILEYLKWKLIGHSTWAVTWSRKLSVEVMRENPDFF